MQGVNHLSKSAFVAVKALLFVAAIALVLAAPQTALAVDESLAAGDVQNGTQADDVSQVVQTAQAVPRQSKYAQVKNVELNKNKATIINNGKVKLKATLVPDVEGKRIKNKKIKWSVSNKKIASVTEKGVVQGKKAGTVTVTAKAANGKKAKARIKVVIQKNKMAKAIPVLTYHRICKSITKRMFFADDDLAISSARFRRQMKWLKDHHYHTISTAELRDWRVNGTFLPKKSVLITIDNGFYETYHVAYPILKRYNFKATSFIIGKTVKKRTKPYNPFSGKKRYIGRDVIREITEEYPNLEFQSHSYDMHYFGKNGLGIATSLSRKAIDKDFAKNARRFDFSAYAHPCGHTSRNVLASLRENKSIKIAFGYEMYWPATRKSPLYNIPRFKVYGDRNLNDFIRIVRTAR